MNGLATEDTRQEHIARQGRLAAEENEFVPLVVIEPAIPVALVVLTIVLELIVTPPAPEITPVPQSSVPVIVKVTPASTVTAPPLRVKLFNVWFELICKVPPETVTLFVIGIVVPPVLLSFKVPAETETDPVAEITDKISNTFPTAPLLTVISKNDVEAAEPLMVCNALVVLKVTIPFLGVNVPLLVQFPPSVIL